MSYPEVDCKWYWTYYENELGWVITLFKSCFTHCLTHQCHVQCKRIFTVLQFRTDHCTGNTGSTGTERNVEDDCFLSFQSVLSFLNFTLLLSLCYCPPSQHICVDLAKALSLVALLFKPTQIADLINLILCIWNPHYILFYVLQMWLSFSLKTFPEATMQNLWLEKGTKGKTYIGKCFNLAFVDKMTLWDIGSLDSTLGISIMVSNTGH